jgi:hypothetical protein
VVAVGAEVVAVACRGETTPAFCVDVMLGRFNNVLDRFSVSAFEEESSVDSCVLDECFAEGLRINEF